MSYDFIVYTQRDRLPQPELLASELAKATPPVMVLGDLFDVTTAGFLPVSVGGMNTGFEVSHSPITAEEVADFEADLANESPEQEDLDYLGILKSCDRRIILRARDDLEIEAAKITAHALAAVSRGFVCDPQTGVTINAGEGPNGPPTRREGY